MVFSGGVPWNPPLCTNGSEGYLMQLSVNHKFAQCFTIGHGAQKCGKGGSNKWTHT